jgi:hypothetical protein
MAAFWKMIELGPKRFEVTKMKVPLLASSRTRVQKNFFLRVLGDLPSWSLAIWNLPVLCLQLADGKSMMTWRTWQLTVFLYFWWNYS